MRWDIQQTVDLAKGKNAGAFNTGIFPLSYTGDAGAHAWEVTVLNNGEPVAISESISASFIRPDGNTVVNTGSVVRGNVARVVIPQAVYAYEGIVHAVMRATIDTTVTTIGAIAFEVRKDSDGEIIDPGSVVPDITQLLAEIDEMREATAEAEAAAEGIGQYVVTGYLNNQGNVVSYTTRSIYTEPMACTEGDVFVYSGRSVSNAVGWIMYNDASIVDYKVYGETVTNRIIIIPAGVNRIQFASMQENGRFPFAYTRIPNTKVVYGNTATHRIPGYILDEAGATATGESAGAIHYAAGYNGIYTDKIACTEGEVYLYTGRSVSNSAPYPSAAAAVLYDGNTVVGTITGHGSEFGMPITIPADVDGVVFASYGTDAAGLAELEINKAGSSLLWGKKINFLGDSYVANNGEPFEDTWCYKLAKKYGMTWRNYGINGNGLVTGTNPMSERYTEMSSDADYVVVVGGTNDFNRQPDMATFKADMSTFVQNLIGKYPRGRIAFFTMWNSLEWARPSVASEMTWGKGEYNDAIVEVCQKYGLPVFDSWRRGEMYPYNSNIRLAFFQRSNDWSHLNAAGHDRFLPIADAFMNSI